MSLLIALTVTHSMVQSRGIEAPALIHLVLSQHHTACLIFNKRRDSTEQFSGLGMSRSRVQHSQGLSVPHPSSQSCCLRETCSNHTAVNTERVVGRTKVPGYTWGMQVSEHTLPGLDANV